MTLRSYALGAVHQALGLVWSEGIAVDATGEPVDLTIRSFGILAARDMPEVEVRLHQEDVWPVNGSDAVFAATLAAAWIAEGVPASWPTRRVAVRTPRRDVAASADRVVERSAMSPAVGPYSPVRRVGDWVITSGQVGLASDESGAATWPRAAPSPSFARRWPNVAEVLATEGATLDDVVKTTLYLVDMGEFAAVNEVWVEYFTSNRPTRSAVAVAALPIGARVEVEAWAYAPVVLGARRVGRRRRRRVRRWRPTVARGRLRAGCARCAGSCRGATPPVRSGSRPSAPSGSGARAPRRAWPAGAGCGRRPCAAPP